MALPLSSSLKGLQAAVAPMQSAPPAMFAGQDPWGNQGTPGGPVMPPDWAQFFTALNAAAPGGIKTRKASPDGE